MRRQGIATWLAGALLASCAGDAPDDGAPAGETDTRDTAGTGDTDGDSAPDTDSARDTAPDTGDTAGDTGDTGPTPTEGAALQFRGARPKNLLVLSLDTVRRQDLGRYDGGDATPFLDGLAATGVALDDHASCSSWTLPGILCASAGRYPEELGYAPRIQELTAPIDIPAGTPFLPTWLAEQGYTSWLVAANGYFAGGERRSISAAYTYREVFSGLPADGVREYALGFVDSTEFAAADRWFLHLHYIDPHAPYAPPDAYLTALEGRPDVGYDLATEEGVRELVTAWNRLDAPTKAEALAQLDIRYRGELRFMDDEIALLWDELDRRGLLDDTLVMVWTDHGEQFFEHGSVGHAGDLYDETTDGVAYFWARNLVPGTWEAPTSNIDLVPTALDALGIAQPAEVTGRIAGLAPAVRPRFQSLVPASGPVLQAVQVDDVRLIYAWDGTKRLMARGDAPRESAVSYDATDPNVLLLWSLLTPEVERLAALLPDQAPVDAAP